MLLRQIGRFCVFCAAWVLRPRPRETREERRQRRRQEQGRAEVLARENWERQHAALLEERRTRDPANRAGQNSSRRDAADINAPGTMERAHWRRHERYRKRAGSAPGGHRGHRGEVPRAEARRLSPGGYYSEHPIMVSAALEEFAAALAFIQAGVRRRRLATQGRQCRAAGGAGSRPYGDFTLEPPLSDAMVVFVRSRERSRRRRPPLAGRGVALGALADASHFLAPREKDKTLQNTKSS